MKKELMLGAAILGLAVGAIATQTYAPPAQAQTAPVTNPGYTPQATLAPMTFAATGSQYYQVNGQGELWFRVSGSGTGLLITVAGSETRAASNTSSTATYATLPVITEGGPRITRIIATGLYRVNVSGLASVRFNVATVTGTITIASVGGLGTKESAIDYQRDASYAMSASAIAPAATPTDVMTLTGNANTTISVDRVECDATATAVGTLKVQLNKHSTADTGGASTAGVAVPFDSTNVASSAVGAIYTGNPTLGTSLGAVSTTLLQLNPTGTTTYGAGKLFEAFGNTPGEQALTLRGVAEQLAINLGGAALPAGTSMNCSIVYREK